MQVANIFIFQDLNCRSNYLYSFKLQSYPKIKTEKK